MTQLFKVPAPGDDPRGVDVDSNGVVWTALAASAHLASFDVRKCTDADLKTAPVDKMLSGDDLPTGLETLQRAGPELPGHDDPDRVQLLQLGGPERRTRIRGQCPDGNWFQLGLILVLNPATSQWVVMRVPYPLGFYSRGWMLAWITPMLPQIFRRTSMLEDPGSVGQLRNALRVAHRRRKRNQGQDREVPDSPQSDSSIAL
jgi:hypothetical protein